MNKFNIITDTLASLQFAVFHYLAYSSFKEETRMNLEFSSSKIINKLDSAMRRLTG